MSSWRNVNVVEHPVQQVLVRNKCCDLTWIPASDGNIPSGSLQGGFTKDKEPVFIGRVAHDGATAIGLVKTIFVQFVRKRYMISEMSSSFRYYRRADVVHFPTEERNYLTLNTKSSLSSVFLCRPYVWLKFCDHLIKFSSYWNYQVG